MRICVGTLKSQFDFIGEAKLGLEEKKRRKNRLPMFHIIRCLFPIWS